MPAPIPDEINAWQEHWRFCRNCFGLFWNNDPNGNKGVCPSPHAPASKFHVAAGWDFYLAADTTNPPGGG
jgi:hypothetical protein